MEIKQKRNLKEVYKTIEELKVGDDFSTNADDIINQIISIKKISEKFYEVKTFCRFISTKDIKTFKINKDALLLTDVIFN